MQSNSFRLLALLAVIAGGALPASGYDLIYGQEGRRVTWNAGSIPFVIRMSQTANLQDGSSYASSVQAAMSAWNGQLMDVQFAPSVAASGLANDGDGVNEIVFDTKIYSNSTDPENPPQEFGANTLAVTLSWTATSPRQDDTYQRTQSDILFNSKWDWNSYRGNLQQPEDIRRVAIHELGHVLGLDHPDQDGQSVTAIMNSTASNVDALQTDDLTGAQFLYGRPGGVTAPSNDNFASAAILTLNSGGTASLTASNVGATKESGEPNHVSPRNGASIWWKWTAPASGSIMVNTLGSHFDTMLAAYTGSSVSSLTQLAANDDTSDNPNSPERRSTITFNVTSGTTYYIAVVGWDAQWGQITLNANFTQLALPSIAFHPQDIAVAAGGQAQFIAEAAGGGVLLYTWQVAPAGTDTWSNTGFTTSGGGRSTYTFTAAANQTGNRYRCVVSNPSGSVTTSAATLTVIANRAPTASLSLSSQRTIGETLSISVTVGDPDSNLSYANLWIRTPNRGWLTMLWNGTLIASGDLSYSNAFTWSSGTFTFTLPLSMLDGAGSYTIAVGAIDGMGVRGDTSQTISVSLPANSPPTASFSLSSERNVNQTLTITLNLSDPDNNLAYANLWVLSPTRGWLSIRADNSVVVSGSLSSANAVSNVPGTQTRTFTFTSADGPGGYSFQLAAVDSFGARYDTPIQTISVLPAVPPAYGLPVSQLDLVVPAGLNHLPIRLPVTRNEGIPTTGFTVASDKAWVTPSFNAATSELVLDFATTGLVAATNDALVRLMRGSETILLPVRAAVSPLNVTRLVDDPARSRVYGLHQNGANAGALIVFDPLAATFVGALTLDKKPGGIAIRADGTELLALCSVSKTLVAVDLTKLAVSETITLSAYDDVRVGESWGDVQYGPGNVIYYSDGAWAPVLRTFDRATKTVLQTLTVDGDGFGDFALNANKTELYAWVQYGWDAGWAGSFVAKYAVGTDGLLGTRTLSTGLSYPNFQRDPLNSPVLCTPNGDVFIKQHRFAGGAIGTPAQSFPSTIYAVSPGGEIVSTSAGIFEVATGNKLYSLTDSPSVQTITSDYARLVYFNPATRVMSTINLFAAIGAATMGQNLAPADGSVVVPPSVLQWTPQPGVDRYAVYLGTDAAVVASATPSSSEYLGEATTSSFTLPNALSPGTVYYWRVDVVNNSGGAQGQVFSFRVATIAVSQPKIDTATVRGHASHRVTLDLTSATAGKAWTAAASVPWIGIVNSTGTTPATLTVSLDASNLPIGVNQGTITLTASEGTLAIPVRLTVDPLAITVIKSAPGSTKVYALSEENASAYTGTSRAYLLEIDALMKRIERVLRVGTAATDLAVHVPDNRVYVANWKSGALLAVNRATFALERTYGFLPAQSMGYTDNDVYRLAAGSQGRLMVIEQDQSINVKIFDTVNGTVVASTGSLYQGRGAYDPSGRYYYHGEYGTTGAKLHKYDTAGDQFTAHTSAVVAGIGYYGATDFLMVEDGSRLFWNGAALRPDLTVEWDLRTSIVAASLDGRYAFSASTVYDIQNRTVVDSLPATAAVSAFNTATASLVYQDGTTIGFYTLATAAPTRTPSDGAIVLSVPKLQWSAIPGAIAYRVYLGLNADSVAAAGTDSPLYLGQVSSPEIVLNSPLSAGQQYFWRVDVVIGTETAPGAVQSFRVSNLVPSLTRLAGLTVQGNPNYDFDVSLVSQAAGQSWTAVTPASWIHLSPAAGVTPATLRVSIDTTALPAGRYQSTVTLTGAGSTVTLPVDIQVDPLALTILKSDASSSLVYGISEDSVSSRAYLVEIDAQSQRILRTARVGSSVTDLAIHAAENRIYVTNWREGRLLALDRPSFGLVHTYPFEPFSYGGSSTGTGDAYHVAAGVAGRVIVEEYDQWVDISLYNTSNATTLIKTNVREGGGQFDPTGRYYYHGESNSTGAMLRKFDMAGDQFGVAGAVRTESASYFGSRIIVVSADGSRVFWNGGVFDASLTTLWTVGENIYSTSPDGRYAFSSTKVYDTVEKRTSYAMPVSTAVSAFNGTAGKLVVQNGSALAFYTLATLPALTAPPSITRQPQSVSTVNGGAVVFDLEFAGAVPMTFQWQWCRAGQVSWYNLYNSDIHVGAQTRVLHLVGVTSAMNGDRFRCVISNANGTVTSAEAVLTTSANRAPTAAFTLSSQRTVGQTITISGEVGDPDGNFAFCNLWVRTPNRGWLTIKADNTIVASGSVSSANAAAVSAGTFTRSFTLDDGPGEYTFALASLDAQNERTNATPVSIQVVPANQAPTASFTLSSERTLGQTITVTMNVGDADGNYAYSNLWVRTPNRGWLTIKADNSVVASGSLIAANNSATSTGQQTRTFTLTAQDGVGEYTFALAAVDSQGERTNAPAQTITVGTTNQAPTASFTLSSERTLGQTITVTMNVGDPDGNYSYSNLWVRTPNRGWLTIKADNSVVSSGSLVAANNSATSTGQQTRTFAFTAQDGVGEYAFALAAVDSLGERTNAPTQKITIGSTNQAPTASFTLSSERTLGQTITVTMNVGDADGNYAYSNLWVRTPGRGWLTIKADNSVVVSGSLSSANNSATSTGQQTRTFAFTAQDGVGEYAFALAAVDSLGERTNAPTQKITIGTTNQAPTASFTLSSERTLGETITVTMNVGDPDGNYAYSNLWVRTPGRGWLTVKADNSVVVSGSLSSANNSATSTGEQTRTFTFTAQDGVGEYAFALAAVDALGERTNAPTQKITIGTTNQAPTASFSLSSERTLGQTITVTMNVGDPDGNYAYSNLWVRTPLRGWLTIKADNSVVVSGSLSSANNSATSTGQQTRNFTFTAQDGAGEYAFALAAVDALGERTNAPTQKITIAAGQAQSALTTITENSYATWAQAHFTATELASPEISGPDAIYGSDGLTNLLKYALGLDPKQDSTAALPQTTTLDGHWFYTYRRPANVSDVSYRVEVSTDLINWTDAGVTEELIATDGNWQTWQAQYHGVTGQSVLFRLIPVLVP